MYVSASLDPAFVYNVYIAAYKRLYLFTFDREHSDVYNNKTTLQGFKRASLLLKVEEEGLLEDCGIFIKVYSQ